MGIDVLFATIIRLIFGLLRRLKRKRLRLVLLAEGVEILMDQIGVDKKRVYTVEALDAKDRPALLDGVPTWTVVPTGGVGLFPAPDGMSCEVTWIAPKASQVLTVTADSDLGSGVVQITATAEIQTLDPTATHLVLTAGPEIDL